MEWSYLQRQRARLEKEIGGGSLRWKFSPALYLSGTRLVALLREHIQGRVLDVGCGRMPFRSFLEGRIELYHGLDLERRSPETHYISDAQNMAVIDDSSYDSVISLSTLEHVPNPWSALSEMCRVCKPGGKIVLALPHISRLHEEPHDYYRFTPYGMRAMAENFGLEIISIKPLGGLFAFLGHQISTVFVCLFWGVPGLKWISFWLNYWLVVRLSILLDRWLKTERKFPMGIVGVFRVRPTP